MAITTPTPMQRISLSNSHTLTTLTTLTTHTKDKNKRFHSIIIHIYFIGLTITSHICAGHFAANRTANRNSLRNSVRRHFAPKTTDNTKLQFAKIPINNNSGILPNEICWPKLQRNAKIDLNELFGVH